MEQYLGSALLSRVKLAADSGQDCPLVFSSTCPWDPAAMTHMMLKFMANSDINLADIAMKAATATMAAASN